MHRASEICGRTPAHQVFFFLCFVSLQMYSLAGVLWALSPWYGHGVESSCILGRLSSEKAISGDG